MKKQNAVDLLVATIILTIGLIGYCLFFGNEYQVTFDSRGGTAIESIYVKAGNTIEKPINPTRSGYEFMGWKKDGKDYDFSTPVRGKVTLVASWRKIITAADISYEVSFETDGGTFVPDQYIAPGQTIRQPTDPVKEGYTFVGWFYGDTQFDFSKKVSQNMKLVARWEEE